MENLLNISAISDTNQKSLFNENTLSNTKANNDFQKYIEKVSSILPVMYDVYTIGEEVTFIIKKTAITADDLNVLLVHGYPYHLAFTKIENHLSGGFRITVKKTI